MSWEYVWRSEEKQRGPQARVERARKWLVGDKIWYKTGDKIMKGFVGHFKIIGSTLSDIEKQWKIFARGVSWSDLCSHFCIDNWVKRSKGPSGKIIRNFYNDGAKRQWMMNQCEKLSDSGYIYIYVLVDQIEMQGKKRNQSWLQGFCPK